MNELELLLNKERPRAFAYCDMGKPFTYLVEINKDYFCDVFNINKVYDFALDDYNYLRRNGVTNAKHESLVRTFRALYNVVDKYGKEMRVIDAEEE